MDFPYIFALRRGVCWYYLGFRSSLWTCIQRIQNMCSLRHMASCLSYWICCIPTKLAHSLLDCDRDAWAAQKVTFLVERRNTPTFKPNERLGYWQRPQRWPFQGVGWRNEALFPPSSPTPVENLEENPLFWYNKAKWQTHFQSFYFSTFWLDKQPVRAHLFWVWMAACKQEY